MRVLSFDVGTKNLSYCYLEFDTKSFQVLDWSVDSCLPVDINVNTTPISDIAPHFYDFALEKSKSWLFEGHEGGSPRQIDHVFIENQPMGFRGGARNLKTKILSHILQVLLLNKRKDLKISFVNPSLKLKDFDREKKSTYAQNKKFAVTKTLEIVTSSECINSEWCKDLLNKSKKKDDLADSFLQGLIAGRLHLNGDVIVSEKICPVKKGSKLEKPLEPTDKPIVKTDADKAAATKSTKAAKPAKPAKPAKALKRKADTIDVFEEAEKVEPVSPTSPEQLIKQVKPEKPVDKLEKSRPLKK